MPENIRALIIILILGLIGFYFARKIIPNDIPLDNFNKLRNVWLSVIISAFLTHNYWLFLLLSSVFITKITKNEKNKVAIFFILAFTIPNLSTQIPGFGLLNYLFTISYPRFLSLVILIPASLVVARKNNIKFFSVWSDKFILLYLLLSVVLTLRDTTFTDMLRNLLYSYTDAFLPYYVVSRSIKNLHDMDYALHAFVTIAIITSLFAIFEYFKAWLLFSSLGETLGTGNDMGGYMLRGGEIRAVASLIHPLVLGAFLTAGFNYYLYTSTRFSSVSLKKIAGLILLLGLFVTISRGPWVGALASIVIFSILGQKPFKKLSTIILYLLIGFTVLTLSPGGEKYIKILPWIGSGSQEESEQGNIIYRERLFENSIIVINRSPFFGSINYLETPEMQEMIQGEGIIDIVNSYIGIALAVGYIGLALFLGVFLSVLWGIKSKMKQVKDKRNSLHTLGASLISAILGTMIIITTVSSIGTIPIIYWSMLGLGVAYTRVVNDYFKPQTSNNIA